MIPFPESSSSVSARSPDFCRATKPVRRTAYLQEGGQSRKRRSQRSLCSLAMTEHFIFLRPELQMLQEFVKIV